MVVVVVELLLAVVADAVPEGWKTELQIWVAMLEGACKYGRHNYRVLGIRASVYYDAARRHMDKWWEGEDIDPDSGLSHITKALASLAVLRDGMICGSWNDDRPPKIPAGFWHALEAHTRDILKRYTAVVAPYTENKSIGSPISPPVHNDFGANLYDQIPKSKNP